MHTHHPDLHRKACTTAALALVLGACSSPAPEAWRVAPLYHVSNAGSDHGYQALARQYEGEHRWREARDAWRKAALAAPQDADTLNALGMAEAGQGLYGKAVEALRRAVALAPQSAQLLNNLGYALLLNGDPEEAKIVLKEALLRKPDHLLAGGELLDLVRGRLQVVAYEHGLVESPFPDRHYPGVVQRICAVNDVNAGRGRKDGSPAHPLKPKSPT